MKTVKRWKVLGRFHDYDEFEAGYFDEMQGNKGECERTVQAWVRIFRQSPMRYRNGKHDGMVFEWEDFEWKLERIQC